jgi:microcystin-dependent protein
MACPDCFKNCGDKYGSDRCIEYTGPDIPALGICTGDTLSQVEAATAENLLAALDGTSIKPTEVTLENCEWIACQLPNTNPSLNQLLQVIINSQCTLKSLIDATAQAPTVFDAKCLVGLPSNPSSVDILQAAVNLLCTHQIAISTLPTTYVKQTDLQSLVLQIIQSNPTKVNFPKNVPVLYTGPLANFDNSGRGIGEYLGWYMMNGLNGTQDWRGRKAVGAVRNVPGAALDTAVNPSVQGAGVNYGTGDKFGSPFVTLLSSEIPPHTHPVLDAGHSHPIAKFWARSINYGNENSTRVLQEGQGANSTLVTPITDNIAAKATTGITVGTSGGGLAHENRDPSVAAVWIVYL